MDDLSDQLERAFRAQPEPDERDVAAFPCRYRTDSRTSIWRATYRAAEPGDHLSEQLESVLRSFAIRTEDG